jgi:hypothetical protein
MKMHNDYSKTISPKLYVRIPKAVLAAIAVSFATNGGELLDDVDTLLLNEWAILFENKIILQRPPHYLPVPAKRIKLTK